MASDRMRSASSHSARFRRFEGTVSKKFVRSSWVLPLSEPPARWTSWKCSDFFTCADPWNIMCSNRCANPERPTRSLRDPTWYHTSTDTSGVE